MLILIISTYQVGQTYKKMTKLNVNSYSPINSPSWDFDPKMSVNPISPNVRYRDKSSQTKIGRDRSRALSKILKSYYTYTVHSFSRT